MAVPSHPPETHEEAIPELAELESVPASSIKRQGWKTVVAAVKTCGPRVVTNHNAPEVVVIEAGEYAALIRRLKDTDPLETLRRRFDERLKSLNAPGAAARLRDALSGAPEQLAEAANASSKRS